MVTCCDIDAQINLQFKNYKTEQLNRLNNPNLAHYLKQLRIQNQNPNQQNLRLLTSESYNSATVIVNKSTTRSLMAKVQPLSSG